MSLYRLYVDENGNRDLNNVANINQRFLGLTGVIVESEHYSSVIQPGLDIIKRKYFLKDADERIVLHRKEIINCRPPFQALREAKTKIKFNETILQAFKEWDYSVVTVVIDKKAHCEKYTTWRFDPYHYCFEVMLERYVLFLQAKNMRGDVLVESRGGKEDIRLKKLYDEFYEKGTDFIEAEKLHTRLTSHELKVKPKEADITGLQIADLIAHPSYRSILLENKLIRDERDTFGDKVVSILRATKYLRSKDGKINGYGTKLLPN